MNDNADEIVRALRSYAKNAQENNEFYSMQDFDAAADLIERLNDFKHSQYAKLLARIAELEAQLAIEHDKYAELQRYNVDCTKQCGMLQMDKVNLQTLLTESQRRERAAVEDLHGTESCYACKYAVDGEMCLCSECDLPDEDCNEKCPWFGDPCGQCTGHLNMDKAVDNWQWRGPQEAGEGEAE